jgi:hypothetical protein
MRGCDNHFAGMVGGVWGFVCCGAANIQGPRKTSWWGGIRMFCKGAVFSQLFMCPFVTGSQSNTAAMLQGCSTTDLMSS